MPINTVALTQFVLRTAPDARVVTLGSQRTFGLLDDDEQIVEDGSGQPITVRTRSLHIAANSLTGVVDGATITVQGTRYSVRGRPMPRENGELWTIRLTKGDT